MGMSVGEKSGGLNSGDQHHAAGRRDAGAAHHRHAHRASVDGGVTLTLPEASNTGDKPDNDNNTTVAVTSDGRYFVDNVQTTQQDLLNAINNALDRKLERILLVKADVNAQYSSVMELMDQLQRAGIENVGLITERQVGGGGE